MNLQCVRSVVEIGSSVFLQIKAELLTVFVTGIPLKSSSESVKWCIENKSGEKINK